jgi:hypothetical protein
MHLRNPGEAKARAFLRHNYLAEAFGNNEPHPEDYAAAVVVGRAAHGAYPTSKLYTAAVAGDPKTMETCHRAAARRYENKGELHHIYKASVDAVTGTHRFIEYYKSMRKNIGYDGDDTCHKYGVGLRNWSSMEEWLYKVAHGRSKQLGQHLDWLEASVVARSFDCGRCRRVARGLAEVVMDAAYAMLAVAPAPVVEDRPALLEPQERPTEEPPAIVSLPPICLREVFARSARAPPQEVKKDDTLEFKVFHYWHGRAGDLIAFRRAMAFEGDPEMTRLVEEHYQREEPDDGARELFEELLAEIDEEVDII